MATGGEDGVVHFWNATDFSRISTTTAMSSAVRNVCFANDVAVAITDNAFRSYSWDQPQGGGGAARVEVSSH